MVSLLWQLCPLSFSCLHMSLYVFKCFMSSYVSYIALVTNYSSAASFFVTAAGKKKALIPSHPRSPSFGGSCMKQNVRMNRKERGLSWVFPLQASRFPSVL